MNDRTASGCTGFDSNTKPISPVNANAIVDFMRPWPASVTVQRAERAGGRITIPGDKSISHRYAMLAALADGTSRIRHYSHGLDCLATLACLRSLGVDVERLPAEVIIQGRGARGLTASAAALDAQNSGTTMRLMTGILAAQPFRTTFIGDESLSRRPMRRVIAPLSRMGAKIDATDGHAPLTIHGGPLTGIAFEPEVPSAQVKSSVLLAGLFASGTTSVEERVQTRDHTERAFETFGIRLTRAGHTVSVDGGQQAAPQDLIVPGDISGAAFWCALAAGTPGGDITIEQVGMNPTRTGFLDVLRRAGADIEMTVDATSAAEPIGTLRARHGTYRSFEITPDEVPGLIDEIPALAAFAAMMPEGHTLTVRGAAELRVKESDRISALAAGFREMGADVEEFSDGFILTARPLRGSHTVDAHDDHRLAMAFMVAATRASAPVTIHREAVGISYPEFTGTFARVTSADADR